ncbi:MAG: hypothetical protein V7644_2174 [Actinomycetota bacterium]|jgi:hypothetical protein
MAGTVFSTPRPEPGHLLPAAGSALVLAVALPICLVAGFSLAGWGLAAVLWLAVHALDLLLARARAGTSSAATTALQAFGLFFKSIGLLAVLFAAVAADRDLALAAAVTYALAYTCELGLSLALYFGASRS